MTAAGLALLVLTLNVAGPRRAHEGWPTRRAAIVVRLKDAAPDAAAFQEVWRGEDLDALASAAGHAHRAREERLGLAVTSRLEIESSAALDLGGGYGALRARLRAGRAGVDVYSARLEPGAGPAAARRLGQLFELAQFVRAESSSRPFAVLGDLAAPADERDSELFLDLLEGRDLCVSHGDEVCGRTLGDRRVDYVVIPYSSRAPRESARTVFNEAAADDDAPLLHFGLRARLPRSFLGSKPAREPAGRGEALAAIAEALAAARAAAERRAAEAGWVPLLGTAESLAARDAIARLRALEEKVRTAQIREAALAGGR